MPGAYRVGRVAGQKHWMSVSGAGFWGWVRGRSAEIRAGIVRSQNASHGPPRKRAGDDQCGVPGEEEAGKVGARDEENESDNAEQKSGNRNEDAIDSGMDGVAGACRAARTIHLRS